jgi:hypothetical protein
MVYLVHSNSYDMNCFSFLSSNKESRTDVRLSLSCCPKRPPSWPVTSTVPRTWWMPPSDRSNTYPLSNLIQTLGGKEAWNFLRLPNGYGSVKKMPGKRRRPYAVRKTVGWHVNPETGKPVQEQITIGYAATRAEGCKYWQSTTIIPLTSRHFASNRKILWSIISEFCPLGFWYVNAL